MRKKLSALVGILALAAATTVQADTYSPGGVTTQFSGGLAVEIGSPSTCFLKLDVQTAPSGTAAIATVVDLAPGDFQCAFYTMSTLWIDMTAANAGLITTSLTLMGVPPTCSSNVPFTWNSASQAISFVNAPVGTACGSLWGTITKISGPSLTMTP